MKNNIRNWLTIIASLIGAVMIFSAHDENEDRCVSTMPEHEHVQCTRMTGVAHDGKKHKGVLDGKTVRWGEGRDD